MRHAERVREGLPGSAFSLSLSSFSLSLRPLSLRAVCVCVYNLCAYTIMCVYTVHITSVCVKLGTSVSEHATWWASSKGGKLMVVAYAWLPRGHVWAPPRETCLTLCVHLVMRA